MKQLSIFSFFFVLMIFCDYSVIADIIHVKANASGAADGSSWPDAYTDLQSALAVAVPGDQIWVATGTYYPSAVGNRVISFTLKNAVELYGGFPAIGEPDILDRDIKNCETILSGDLNKNNFRDINDTYHIVYADSVNSNTIIDGFTVTGGYSSGTGLDQFGGGMYITNSSLKINNCNFINNATGNGRNGEDGHNDGSSGSSGSPGGNGAGIFITNNSSLEITSCIFNNNITGNGGRGGNGQDGDIWGTTYGGNGGNGANSGFGAGIYNINSSITLVNCIFHNNQTGNGGYGGYGGDGKLSSDGGDGGNGGNSGSGSAIFNANGPLTITNCTFYSNRTGLQGSPGTGGSSNFGDDGNNGTSGLRGYGGAVYSNTSPTIITNSILWQNSPDQIKAPFPDITYSDILGGTGQSWFGTGCIDSNPLFANAPAGDLRLQVNSPCINIGDNNAENLPATDFQGDPRIIDTTVDIGADELLSYSLSYQIEPPEGGTVTLNPSGGKYIYGTEVTVTANNTGWYMFHFSGDLAGNDKSQIINMDSDKTVTANFTPAGGAGTEYEPYQIKSFVHLHLLSETSSLWGTDTYFELTGDITIPSGFTINPIGNDTTPFDGNFNGMEYSINGLQQNGNSDLGLFGQTGSYASISNLSVLAAAINGSADHIGILVGYNKASIANCYTSGHVTGDNIIGGLCGFNQSSISNCYSNCNVKGNDYLGGLCGRNYSSGIISNCYSTGKISGNDYMGGLCGRNYTSATITGSFSACDIIGQDGSFAIGGLCGFNYSSISNCYSTGNVSGGDSSGQLGGLCGINFSGTIDNCYSTGNITGGNFSQIIGGLCGHNGGNIIDCYSIGSVTSGDSSLYLGGLCGEEQGDKTNCFWDIQTSGTESGVGKGPETGVTGKTTDQMKQLSTFINWDFTNTWLIINEKSYPYQDIIVGRLEIKGDNNKDGKVDLLDLAILATNWLEEM
ncbi:MAG: hypothetical protein JEZ07_09690 [Phycisphaerae bacterium]|nr:hypothetical protein [Phycisphaerae bacterium]